MEAYKYIEQEDDTILLEKITIDTTRYEITKQNGNLLLKPIHIVYATIGNPKDIKKFNFCYSKISNCRINDIFFPYFKYKSILTEIYKIINDGTKIIKNTILNIKTIKKEDDCFYYLSDIGISVEDADSNSYLYEIMQQCIENKIKLILTIKLKSETIIDIFI